MELLAEERYIELREMYGDGFVAGIGAEAVRTLLEEIDLESMITEVRAELSKVNPIPRRKNSSSD